MGLSGLKEARLVAEQVGRRVHENGEKTACKWASRLLRFGLGNSSLTQKNENTINK